MGKYISDKERQRKKYDGMPTLYAYCDACLHRNNKEKCNAVREKNNDYCNKIIRTFEREQQKISDETAPEYYVTVRQRGVEKFVSFDFIGKYISLKTVYQDCSKLFKEDAEIIADILQQEIDAGNACYTDVEIREVLMDITGNKRAKRYDLDKKDIQAKIKYPKYMNKAIVATKRVEVPDDYSLMIKDTQALASKEKNRVSALDQSQLELLGGGFCQTVPADSPVDILKLLIKPYNSFERMPLDYVYKNTIAYLDSLTTPVIDSSNNIIGYKWLKIPTMQEYALYLGITYNGLRKFIKRQEEEMEQSASSLDDISILHNLYNGINSNDYLNGNGCVNYNPYNTETDAKDQPLDPGDAPRNIYNSIYNNNGLYNIYNSYDSNSVNDNKKLDIMKENWEIRNREKTVYSLVKRVEEYVRNFKIKSLYTLKNPAGAIFDLKAQDGWVEQSRVVVDAGQSLLGRKMSEEELDAMSRAGSGESLVDEFEVRDE